MYYLVCNHLNLKILIHIFTIIYLIMIVIIMRGENFVAHRCAAEHRLRITALESKIIYTALVLRMRCSHQLSAIGTLI
jgi:hypothetical protein